MVTLGRRASRAGSRPGRRGPPRSGGHPPRSRRVRGRRTRHRQFSPARRRGDPRPAPARASAARARGPRRPGRRAARGRPGDGRRPPTARRAPRRSFAAAGPSSVARTRASRSIWGSSSATSALASPGAAIRASRTAPAGTPASTRAFRIRRTRSRIASTSASAARSRPAGAGHAATITSSGSSAAWGSDDQSASVTNGMTGCSRRTNVSSDSTSVHHVASRAASVSDVVREPCLRQLEAPVAELGPDAVVQRPGDLGELVLGDRADRRPPRSPRSATGSSARPARGRPGPAAAATASAGIDAGRTPSTNRVAFHSLFAKLRPVSSFCGPNFWSWPGVAPWITANRSASAPASSITTSGSTTLPFVFDMRWPCASRMSPDRYTVWNGSTSVRCSPSIIIRATQKNRMSWPVSMTEVG